METGISKTITKTVEFKDTAKAFASGLAEVFATPSMIALMENAAYSAVQGELKKGESTVGISIDAKHIAATPVGMEVSATATLVEIDRKRLVFDIEAFDEKEKIGSARHERFIIDEERFMSKVAAKQE